MTDEFLEESLHSLNPHSLKAFPSYFEGLPEVVVAWIRAQYLSRGFSLLPRLKHFRFRFPVSTPPLRSLTALCRGVTLAAVDRIASANVVAIPSTSVPMGTGVNLSMKAPRSWGFAVSCWRSIARPSLVSRLRRLGANLPRSRMSAMTRL